MDTFDTIGDVMRAARDAARAHARSLRPDIPIVVDVPPREASPTWRTDIRCTYCGAALDLATEPPASAPVPEPTWSTVTQARCTNTRCAHLFDIDMRIRPRAPRRTAAVIHPRNRAATAATLIDTITGALR